MVEDVVLMTGNHLQQRLNEIYSLSDDEEDTIDSKSSSVMSHHPENGAALYGNVRQVKMQLGL